MEVLTSNTSIEKTPTGEEKKGGSATMDTKERITLQKVFDTLQAAAPEMDDVNRAHLLGYGEAIIDIRGSKGKKNEPEDKQKETA